MSIILCRLQIDQLPDHVHFNIPLPWIGFPMEEPLGLLQISKHHFLFL